MNNGGASASAGSASARQGGGSAAAGQSPDVHIYPISNAEDVLRVMRSRKGAAVYHDHFRKQKFKMGLAT
jgi:hypothetical protein